MASIGYAARPGFSRVLCRLWGELRQVHELAVSSAVEREVRKDSPGETAGASSGSATGFMLPDDSYMLKHA